MIRRTKVLETDMGEGETACSTRGLWKLGICTQIIETRPCSVPLTLISSLPFYSNNVWQPTLLPLWAPYLSYKKDLERLAGDALSDPDLGWNNCLVSPRCTPKISLSLIGQLWVCFFLLMILRFSTRPQRKMENIETTRRKLGWTLLEV